MPVYKDTKRNTWYAKFRYKNWKGEVKCTTKRGFPTKRDALQFERDFQQRQAGDLNMNFGQFVQVYQRDIQPRLKESTWETKRNIINNQLIPYFKSTPMCQITAVHVVQWQNELLSYRDKEGKGYSSSYLKTVHNQLSAILNHAVRFYNLQCNTAQKAGNIGSEREISMKFWTREEYQKFAEEKMRHPQAYYAFQLLYWCGLREGELLALEYKDFDFEEKTVTVSKTYHRLRGRDIVTSPKTPKSRRSIVMPQFLCEEMMDYFTMCETAKTATRAFPVSKHFLHYQMKQGAAQAGVKPIRIHDLRHSHVSLLIHLGFHAVAIADRMGHESIDVTYRYAHLFPTVQTQMASQLDEVWEVRSVCQ